MGDGAGKPDADSGGDAGGAAEGDEAREDAAIAGAAAMSEAVIGVGAFESVGLNSGELEPEGVEARGGRGIENEEPDVKVIEKLDAVEKKGREDSGEQTTRGTIFSCMHC